MPGSKQIKASAGSGKTYEITRCFLERLARSGAHGTRPPNEVLGELIAITFTNAAACEMRDRIISHLKRRALGEEDESGPAGVFSPEAARSWLEYILKNPNALNVRTIDSLLHLIVRTAALPLGLDPGYSPVFESEGLIRPHLERLFEQARAEGRQGQSHRLLQDAFAALPDTTKGFLAHDRILDRLKRILENILAEGCDDLADKGALDKRLGEMEGAVRLKAKRFLELTAEYNWKKPSREAFEKLSGPLSVADRIKLLQQKSAGAAEAEALFIKAFITKNPLPQNILDAFSDCRKANSLFLKTGAVLDLASRSMPFVRLSRRILNDYRKSPESEAYLLNSQVARTVAGLLGIGGDMPVPQALYRIGTKLRHFLIDEFQDTGNDQWQAINLLVEEALSQGGSLIWVGDVKQSIYGWRGGNPLLFDTILPPGAFERQTLPSNWRTRKDLVDFNNRFFAPLADKPAAEDVLQHLFPAEFSEDKRAEALERVMRAFTDARQTIPDKKKNGPEGLGGFAEIADPEEDMDGAPVESGEDATGDDRILALLLAKLSAIHERRPWSDIWILVRSNDQGQKAVSHLLENDIPVITENSLLLAKNPLIVQAVAFLRFLDDPDDVISFLTFATGDIVAEKFAALGFSDPAFLRHAVSTRDPKELILRFRQNWPDIWKSLIAPFSSHSSIMSPYDVIAEWFDPFQVEERFPGSKVFLRRFLEVLHTAEDSDIGTISDFLEFWDSDDQDEKVPMPTDVNAVRVMTIHKAKGLEAPVVILPWVRLEAKARDDKFVFRNCDGLKVLVPVRKVVQPEYDDEMIKSGCESLNLLYVSFTRARDELYVFYHPEKKQDGPFETLARHAGFSVPCTAGELPHAGDNDAGTDEPLAEPPTKASRSDADAAEWKPMRWLPRLKILHNFNGDARSAAQERGTFLHSCLEHARYTGDAEADAERALRAGMSLSRMASPPTAEEQKDFAAALAWFLSQPEAERWMNEVMREQDIMAKDGKVYRMDLLVWGEDDDPLVIDYKSGEPTEKDMDQMRNFMDLLGNEKKAGHELRALLVYLDKRAFRLVGQKRDSGILATYAECVAELQGAP